MDQLNHSLKNSLNSLHNDLKCNFPSLDSEINVFGEPIAPTENALPLPLPSFKTPLNQRHRQSKRKNMRKKTSYKGRTLRKRLY